MGLAFLYTFINSLLTYTETLKDCSLTKINIENKSNNNDKR